MKETIVVDAEAYRWLGDVIERLDQMSMNGQYVGKTTWEASNAFDALLDNLEKPTVEVDGSTSP